MSALLVETEMTDSPVATASACIVCGETRFVRHFSRVPHAKRPPEPKVYRITHSERRMVGCLERCTGCGLVVLPESSRVIARYEDSEDPYYTEQAAQRIANAHALLDLVPCGGRLLEVGCAYGFLLQAARERGFEVIGVEPSVSASEYARRHLGLEVLTGYFGEVDLPETSFDVVVMADVIEHLPAPQKAVRLAKQCLKAGGRLIVLTPDIGSLMARFMGSRWYGLLDDHYYYFSRNTLRRLLSSEGFEIERLAAHGRRFSCAHWAFKLSQYSQPLSRGVLGGMKLLGIDRLQLRINFGDQMACVARKPR